MGSQWVARQGCVRHHSKTGFPVLVTVPELLFVWLFIAWLDQGSVPATFLPSPGPCVSQGWQPRFFPVLPPIHRDVLIHHSLTLGLAHIFCESPESKWARSLRTARSVTTT